MRLAVASRVAAAALGGYALAAVAAAGIAAALPASRLEAGLTGSLAGLLLQVGAIIWAFSARTAGRAWAGIVLPGLVFGLLVLWGQA